jgi:transposase InsO family protein
MLWRLSNAVDVVLPCGSEGRVGSVWQAGDLRHQGSQFASRDITVILAGAGIHISMGGRGRWIDNVFIERPCLKYGSSQP